MRRFLALATLLAMGCSKLPPAPVDAPVPLSADITFVSTPPGATVTLDGHALAGVTPLTQHMSTGAEEHAVRFDLAGYASAKPEPFLVPIRPYTVAATLLALPKVGVQTDPPGARVFVDGALALASTPGSVALTADAHEVRVELDGRVPARLHLAAGDIRPLVLALPLAAFVAVTSKPASGARIRVDGVDTGLLTPATDVPVAAGRTHRIDALVGDLASHPQRVPKLRPGAHAKVSLELADLGRDAMLARRREVQRQIAQLQAQEVPLKKLTSAFEITDAHKEHAEEDQLQRDDDALEQLEDELSDLDDKIDSP